MTQGLPPEEASDQTAGAPNNVELHPIFKARLFKKGADLFNDESYFEAHEEWEKLWKDENSLETKVFLQACIQTAAHFIHLKEGRWSAALSQAELAMTKFTKSSFAFTGKIPKPFAPWDTEPLPFALGYNMELLKKNETNLAAFVFPKLIALGSV